MKNNKNFLITVIAVVILGVIGAAIVQNQRPAPMTTSVEETVEAATIPDEAPVSAAVEDSAVNYDSASLPDTPLGIRTLGNPDAPVKIEEFASLTCGHCASFHNSTFQQLKSKYIDTGKVFFTFTDFPLNAPALDATMVARCMPPERYFTFLSFLFQTQEQWAFSQDYRNSLRQNAKLAGMSDERFDSCLEDESLKEGIIGKMQEKAETHALNSTPSFVINGATVITGSVGIDVFDQAIAEAEANLAAPSPETLEETPEETVPEETVTEETVTEEIEEEIPAETSVETEVTTEQE